MKLFLLSFLFSVPAFAWDMTFQQESHLGATAFDSAAFTKGDYHFGGRNLGSKLPPAILKAWGEIEKGPSVASRSKFQSCPAGKFKYLKNDSISKTVEGCITSSEYKKFMTSLVSIREYVRGRK